VKENGLTVAKLKNVARKGEKAPKTLLTIYYQFRRPIGGFSRFYEVQMNRSVVLNRSDKLDDDMASMRKLLPTVNSLRFYQVFKHHRALSRLSNAVSKTTLSLVDRQEAYGRYLKALDELRDSVENVPLYSAFSDYLIKASKDLRAADTESIGMVLERIDSELGRRSGSESQLLSTLIGAFIGAGLAILVAWLTHPFSK
jgi:hypothetical protein